MAIHYCHNCKHHSNLPDGVFCQWCLDRFAELGRLPMPADSIPATDPVSRINRALDALISEG